MTKYVKMGTTIEFNNRRWIAQEPALSFYLDMHGPTVFVSEPDGQNDIEQIFAEVNSSGELMMRSVATVQGETSEGGGVGQIGVPGMPLGMAKVSADNIYEG